MRKHLQLGQLITSYVVSSLWLKLRQCDPYRFALNGQRHAARILQVLNVSVTVRGTVPARGAVVANHVSYLDILVLMATLPTRFVTFTEMRAVPGVGFLVGLSRTILVNRSRPARVREDIRVVAEALGEAVPVIFFPEGTSHDGEYLRPFRPALFSAVAQAQAPLTTCCLRYLSIDGDPVTRANRDRLFFYGDMELLPQLFSIFKLRSVAVELVWGETLSAHEQDRKSLAEYAHGEINRHFLPVGEVC